MKIIYFSKTIVAYNLKVGSYTELNYLMKLHEYQRSMPLFDRPQRSLHFQTSICFSQKLLGYLKLNIM